ncbi:MAG: tetratricopeptide repeat protein [Spirochaetales bacterium]|nr:tetratricopeptide repeat protein [Spirochaetales bacterium]
MIRFKFAVFAVVFFATVSAVFAEQKDALEAFRNGRYQEAVDICNDELKANPQNMDSYVVLCWALQKMGKYQDALNDAQQALKINPYDFRVIEIIGESDFYLGKIVDALHNFEQYTVLAPSGDRIQLAYYYMGEIFLQLGEYNHADIALTTAVYYAPQTPNWWARLGYARMLAKDYPSAQKAYEEALRQDPNNVDAQRGKQQVQKAIADQQAQ